MGRGESGHTMWTTRSTCRTGHDRSGRFLSTTTTTTTITGTMGSCTERTAMARGSSSSCYGPGCYSRTGLSAAPRNQSLMRSTRRSSSQTFPSSLSSTRRAPWHWTQGGLFRREHLWVFKTSPRLRRHREPGAMALTSRQLPRTTCTGRVIRMWLKALGCNDTRTGEIGKDSRTV